MDVEPIIDGVKYLAELSAADKDKAARKFVGSIDPLTAANWSRECGHSIGTKPWAEYAKKKLMSGDYSKFRADYQRKFY